MFKRFTYLLIPFLVFRASFAYSISPYYFGIEPQVRYMNFKEGFGGNLLTHHYPQINLYGGYFIDESTAIEFGYEETATRTRCVMCSEGDAVNGYALPKMLSPAWFESKIKIKGPHFDVVGFYCLNDYPRLRFVTSIGLSFSKATAERLTISVSEPPIHGGRNRTFVRRKVILRLSHGLQYDLNDNFFTRGTIQFVNSNNLRLHTDDEVYSTIIPSIKPRDSIVYSLGMGYRF